MRIKLVLYFIFWSLIFSQFGSAQVQIDLALQSGYLDNLFRNYNRLGDQYSEINPGIRYDWLGASRGFRLQYHGQINLYRRYQDLNWMQHQVGWLAFQNLTESGSLIRAGMNFSRRTDSQAYRYYDNNQFNGFANVKWIAQENLYFYGGYIFRNRDYFNLSAFSFQEQLFFIQGSWFLPTQTTLMARIDYQHKNYSDNRIAANYWGLTLAEDSREPNQQVLTLLKLAQALFAKTGLSGDLMLRRNLSTGVRYLQTTDGYWISNEEVFTDPYAYEGEDLGLSLKQLLPWRSEFSLSVSWEQRRYVHRLAYDLEGNQIDSDLKRKDQLTDIFLTFSKSLKLGQSGNNVGVDIYLGHVISASNDPFFRYRSNEFSMRIRTDL